MNFAYLHDALPTIANARNLDWHILIDFSFTHTMVHIRIYMLHTIYILCSFVFIVYFGLNSQFGLVVPLLTLGR